jgi:hypothetical protein
LQIPRQGSAMPVGSGGFQLNNSIGRLAELRVSRIAPSIDPELVFAAGFEATDVPNLSQCRLLD